MFPLKPSLTISEVTATHQDGTPDLQFPTDGRCKSGHGVPPGTRFFMVSGETLPRLKWGVYCEPCLIVANKMAKSKREAAKVNPANINDLDALIKSTKRQ